MICGANFDSWNSTCSFLNSTKKGYFHSTISMQSFRIGFFRLKQNSARTGRSGCAFPPRRTGRFGAGGVADCPAAAMAVAVVDGAPPPPIGARLSMPPFAVPLLAILRLRKNNDRPLRCAAAASSNQMRRHSLKDSSTKLKYTHTHTLTYH